MFNYRNPISNGVAVMFRGYTKKQKLIWPKCTFPEKKTFLLAHLPNYEGWNFGYKLY